LIVPRQHLAFQGHIAPDTLSGSNMTGDQYLAWHTLRGANLGFFPTQHLAFQERTSFDAVSDRKMTSDQVLGLITPAGSQD